MPTSARSRAATGGQPWAIRSGSRVSTCSTRDSASASARSSALTCANGRWPKTAPSARRPRPSTRPSGAVRTSRTAPRASRKLSVRPPSPRSWSPRAYVRAANAGAIRARSCEERSSNRGSSFSRESIGAIVTRPPTRVLFPTSLEARNWIAQRLKTRGVNARRSDRRVPVQAPERPRPGDQALDREGHQGAQRDVGVALEGGVARLPFREELAVEVEQALDLEVAVGLAEGEPDEPLDARQVGLGAHQLAERVE